ncbi:MAG: TetR family transcriptional regulator [Pseudomonadota bacterium]
MSDLKDIALDINSVRTKVPLSASNILATGGAEALSLRVIAESAGIGLASIYHYFANKDVLLVSLALSGFSELQIQIIWEEILKRFPEIIVTKEPTYTRSTFVKGYESMMVMIPKKNAVAA